MRLRRARVLQIHWHAGQMCFHNPLQRKTVTAAPLALHIIDAMPDWTTVGRLLEIWSEFELNSLIEALTDLVDGGLLVIEGSPEGDEDERVSSTWAPWLPHAAFHFSTKNTPYVTAEAPIEIKRATLPDTPQPAHFKPSHGDEAIVLPTAVFPVDKSEFLHVLLERRSCREFSAEPVTLAQINTLLRLVWGVQGHVDTELFGRLPLKTSPSGGARHPGEVYLLARNVTGLAPGIYHYHSLDHTLKLIREGARSEDASAFCADQGYIGTAAALFIMTAVFERAMWKYHKPRAYRVVTLDTGHLGQTFCLAATWLGLGAFGTAALNDTLVEQALGIDGATESVLFVTGVGVKAGLADKSDSQRATGQT